MTRRDNEADATPLAPDEAFDVLGNDTRMEILRTLWEADEPLAFSELYDRVEYDSTANFNYHLDKLVGHFIHKTDDEYALRQAGQRVIETVISGAVTDAVAIEWTRLDTPCPYCGAAIEVNYREEALLLRCTECVGTFAGAESSSPAYETLPDGTLTLYYLPPAGVLGRDPRELLDAALAHTYLEGIAMGNDFCPQCGGIVDHTVNVCQDHTSDGEICDQCNTRFAVMLMSRCTNCQFVKQGTIKHRLFAHPEVRSFFEARGVDTLAPDWEDMTPLYTYDEEVLGIDPFEARFTFTVASEDLVVTVDDDLNVVDIKH